MRTLLISIILLTNFLVITPLFSQVNLKLIIRTPTPSELTEWELDPTIVQIIVTNYAQNQFLNAFFVIKITDEQNKIVAQNTIDNRLIPRVNIPAGISTTIFNGAQVLNVNSLTIDSKIKNKSPSDYALPEGNYEICISLYDSKGANITAGTEVCSNFSIYIPEPPVLIAPVDDEVVTNPFPNFLWMPVTGYQPGMSVKYKLKICPVLEGQTPRTALESNPVLLEKTEILTTSYQYLPSDLPFTYFPKAIQYVWIVQAFDKNGNPAASNQGQSNLGIFRIQKENASDITLSNIYPTSNDTVPWGPPHLVVQYSPYSDDIRTIQFTLTVKKEGSSQQFTHTRLLNFPEGPLTSQKLTSQDQASLIISNLKDDKTFVDWMNTLEQGVKYSWYLTATFTKANGSTINASSSETSFIIGLRKPINIYPSKDTSIQAKSEIKVSFKISSPNTLNFANNTVLADSMFHGSNSYSTAQGKFSIEFAKKSSFDSVILNKTFEVPSGNPCRTGSECTDLFKKISISLDGIKDTSKYFWRICYINSSGTKYYTGNTRTLKIVKGIQQCFDMKVESPVNNGTWTTNKNPRFAVSVKPTINKNAITGGRIKIWKMNSLSDIYSDVKRKKPLVDTTFTGYEDKKVFAYSTDMMGYTRYDLNFINGDSASVTFTADSAASYLWNFKLQYKKESIRTDNTKCDSSSVMSNDGIFTVSPSPTDSSACMGNCFSQTPTNQTPSNQTFAADSIIKIGQFNLKLKTVSGNGSFLSGEGSIDIPLFRGDIKVEFNGLKVNSNKEVYEGEVNAKIAADAPYTKSEGNDYEGKALSFAQDKAKFKNIYDYSSASGRLVSGLISSNPVDLPIGFDHNYGGYKVVFGIIGMKFTPNQAVLNAATYVELPALGPDVGFGLGAKNICFNTEGYSGNGKIILYLADDFGYRDEGSWSFLFKAPTPIDSGTYMVFDCKKFKEFVIAADVEFPRSWLKPAPDNGEQVAAHFKTKATKSGNGWQWIASANLPECEFSNADGFKMQVQEMTFDYSTVENPVGMAFPKNYTGTVTKEWKGFYIKRAAFTMPDKLKTFSNTAPVLSLNNLIIDKTGFTASIRAEDIFHYPEGNFGNWGASIDTLKIDFVSSSLQSGALNGRIKVSFIDSALLYSGLIMRPQGGGSLRYLFNVHPKDTVKADIWKAKLNLYPTSRIELGDTSGSFLAQAVFNGKFTLDGDVGGVSKLGFKGIAFEGFKIMSQSPYIEKGTWSFASPEHSMSGFPVSINHLNIVTGDRGGSMGAGIQFNLNVNLQSGSDAISGTTTLSVWGKLESGSGPQCFAFDGVDLDSIGVTADLNAVKISGGLKLYSSNSTFGDGFKGKLRATFIDQFEVEATAQFGSVSGYRYWYVDAKAIFDPGIPVFTGLGIYGFGGGAWYHMRKSGETNLSVPAQETDAGTTPGKTNSGYSYMPDKTVDFGFQASMIMGTHPSPDAFNGDVSLEAQFLSGGGLGTISLLGKGYLLCSLTNRQNAKILANVDLEYNYPLRTFHGVFDVDIKANPFTGGGQMVMHFAPDLWYIKIGEPSNRVGISLANWLSIDGYFMVGQDLPAIPPLPSQIQELFPGWGVTNRNPTIETGDGFAFGASASFNTGRQTFLIFYGEFSAIIGFDFALLNYGPGTTCEGHSGNIGVNGWYAMGQVYAAVSAEIGIHIDLYFVEGDFEILSLQVGAALQGAGPNPTWVRGTVGGNYRLLGGIIKGHCSFDFKKGSECVPVVENPLARLDIISDINPVSGSNNVDVFTEPQVATNFELDTPFELEEMPTGSDPPKVRTFRVKLGDFNLRAGNDSVAGNEVIAPDLVSAYYSPHDMLPGNKSYRFTVSAYGEEYKSGTWQPAVKKDGSLITQSVQSQFTTGPEPDVIVQSNVGFSYPYTSQRYFLQDECRKGRIQLMSGQPAVFAPKAGCDLQLIARFIPNDIAQSPVDVPFTYNGTSCTVDFNVPPLINSKDYYLQIIRKDVNQAKGGKAQFVSEIAQYENLMLNISNSNVYYSQRRINATRVKPNEKLLYVYPFRTSNFNTFQAKLNSFTYSSTESDFSGIFETHTAKYIGTEYFESIDFSARTWTRSGTIHNFGPLVQINGSERTSAWHNAFANPTVYNNIQWIKSKGWWSGNVEYDQCLTDPSHKFVEVSFNTYQFPVFQLSHSGIAAYSLSGGASTSGGKKAGKAGAAVSAAAVSARSSLMSSVMASQQQASPYLAIKYRHGIITATDYILLRLNAACTLFKYPNLNATYKTKLSNILSTDYQSMLRGNYPLKYFYNYDGCIDVDTGAPTISKPFVY
jgi:hypothetical protein